MNHHECLDNKTPKESLESIHTLVLSEISTNKVEPVELHDYGNIASKNEYPNKLYILCFV